MTTEERERYHSVRFWTSAAGTSFNALMLFVVQQSPELEELGLIFVASGAAMAAGMGFHYVASRLCNQNNSCGSDHGQD